jgi:hypothetical protein
MAKINVHRFSHHDISTDKTFVSRRWGTREGIKRIGGMVLEDTEVEVDEALVGRRIEGLSDIGFDPSKG